MPKFFNYCLIVISAQLALGCSSNSVQQDSSLYHAIGGHDGIERIVNAFTLRIVQDKSILPYFLKSNVTHFKQGFISHLCDAVGGPCQYKGDTMHDIHTGMKITEKDFNRTVELLMDAMEDAGIDYRSQNKILKQLAPSRKTIIKI
jgi:hemoglobin